MIEQEFDQYVGVCDACGETTPRFNTWKECRYFIRTNGWETYKNPETGEWENLCPECKQYK